MVFQGPQSGRPNLLNGCLGSSKGHLGPLGLTRQILAIMQGRSENSVHEVSKEFFETPSSPFTGTYLSFPLTDFDKILMKKYLRQIFQLLVKSPSFYLDSETNASLAEITTPNWFSQQLFLSQKWNKSIFLKRAIQTFFLTLSLLLVKSKKTFSMIKVTVIAKQTSRSIW